MNGRSSKKGLQRMEIIYISKLHLQGILLPMYMFAIYNKLGTNSGLIETNHKIEEVIEDIFKLEKRPNIIIGGDFNHNISESLRKQEPGKIFNALRYLKEYPFVVDNFIESTCMRNDGSLIDFLITTVNLEMTNKRTSYYPIISDHKLLSVNIVLNAGSGRNKQMIPNKKLGREIIGEALKSKYRK